MACKVNYVNVSPGRLGPHCPPHWDEGHQITKSTHLSRLLFDPQCPICRGARQRGNHRLCPGFWAKGGQRQTRTSACGESSDVVKSCADPAGRKGVLRLLIKLVFNLLSDGPSDQQHMKKQETGEGFSLGGGTSLCSMCLWQHGHNTLNRRNTHNLFSYVFVTMSVFGNCIHFSLKS